MVLGAGKRWLGDEMGCDALLAGSLCGVDFAAFAENSTKKLFFLSTHIGFFFNFFRFKV